MLNFFTVPIISAIIENNASFSSGEALQFVIVILVIHNTGQDMAEACLSLLLLDLHKLIVYEYQRIILDHVGIVG
jgi:hypothetical protein